MRIKDWELLKISPGDSRFPRMLDYYPYLLEPLDSDLPRSFFHFTLVRRSSITWFPIKTLIIGG